MSFAHAFNAPDSPSRRRRAWIAAGMFAAALLGGLVAFASYN
jgi:hypothetical protein